MLDRAFHKRIADEAGERVARARGNVTLEEHMLVEAVRLAPRSEKERRILDAERAAT